MCMKLFIFRYMTEVFYPIVFRWHHQTITTIIPTKKKKIEKFLFVFLYGKRDQIYYYEFC